MSDKQENKILTSDAVYRLSSFKLFCDDIGIDHKMPISAISIQLGQGDFVNVDVSFKAHKKEPK